jgi:ribose/xylose/arabinose/galactoside ABC-type transport system permease subunit
MLDTGSASRSAGIDAAISHQTHSRLSRMLGQQAFWVFVAAVLACLTLSIVTETFATPQNLFNVTRNFAFVGIVALGMTVVIISGGIDLSVGSIYALSGVAAAILLRAVGPMGDTATVLVALLVCAGVGVLCGIINGALVVGLKVHPFIITLGTMWVLRGIAFVATKAESILLPEALTGFAKAPLGLGGGLYPVPMLLMLAVALYLTRTVPGRHVFAFGGNLEASRFAGLPLGRIQIGVFAVSGLTAGLAAFLGAGFYGSVSSGDAQGYELYVIAAAVVGGASLVGGRGSAFGAMLGALLIVLFRQSIRTLRFDQNYEWIVVGCAIIVAVVIDQWSARAAARRLARAAEAVPG